MNKIEEIERYMRRMVLFNEDVNEAIADLKAEGYSDDEIANELAGSSGYSKDEISNAIANSYVNPTPKAKRKNKTKSKSKAKTKTKTNDNAISTINTLTDGNQASWTENPNLTTSPTPEQINDMRNTLNTAQQGDNNTQEDTTQDTNNQETPNPQSSEVQNTEQSFANEWIAIKKEVDTIKNNFTALRNDAINRGYIKNPQALKKLQSITGVIAGIGSAATMVGTILSFIPGMQPIAMGLRSAGMAVGGLGTAANRSISSANKFRSGDKKGAILDAGMALMGAGTAFAGGQMFKNQFFPHTDNKTILPQPQQDNSQFKNGQVNQVPQNHQNQIGSGAPANPTPQGFDATLDTINKLTNGNQADWPHNPAVQAAFTPEQIAIMRNTINTSPQGITQMGELSAAQAAESRAQDAFTQGQDYSELQARENAGAEYAANKVNAFTNTANNLQNQFDNTDFRGGGRETAGRTEYATNLMNNINKNRELADSWQDTRDSFVANGDRFGSQAQNFNNLGQSEQAAAAAHMNNYNKGL